VGTAVDNALAIENFDKACERGIASSCFSASSMYRGLNDLAKAEGFAESSAGYVETGLSAKAAAVPAFCS
jgi:TPR repeat protein